MAPTMAYRRSLDALDACTGACNLGLIIGCVAPVFIAISTFSIVLIRRRFLAERSATLAQQEELASNGGSSFGMLHGRLSTIHPGVSGSLQNILVDSSKTVPEMHIVSMDSVRSIKCTNDHENCQWEDTGSDSGIIDERRPSTPLLALPSLSSMLGDFLSYGDAISDQKQRELTITSDTKLAQRPGTPLHLNQSSFVEGKKNGTSSGERFSQLVSPSGPGTSTTTTGVVKERDVDPYASMAVDELVQCLQSEPRITATPSKPILAVTTTLWSILVNSNSTLETLLPVRLDDFPSIPQVNLGLVPNSKQDMTISVSRSTLALAISRSMSAPASLNLLGEIMDDLPRRFCLPSRHNLRYSQPCDPGQLWDEEDECKYNKLLAKFKPSRNTWTAGVSYSHSSGPGELWDEEDERRISLEVTPSVADACLEALSTFATLSFASIELTSVTACLGDFERSFQSISVIPMAASGSSDGDTTIGSSNSLESSKSTNMLLPHKSAGADLSLYPSQSEGLCICQENFAGFVCVCDGDASGGATIVELDDDVGTDALKRDMSFGYQDAGLLLREDDSQISLSFDENDIKSQSTSPSTTISSRRSSTRSSIVSFTGLREFDFEVQNKHLADDCLRFPVVDMDIEPNSFYLSAISYIRLPWPWVTPDFSSNV